MEPLPSAAAANATACPVSLAAHAADAWPHIVFLRVPTATRASEPQHTAARASVCADWLTCCYRLTPRVQRLSATDALLDLGTCSGAEAVRVVERLLRRLAGMRLSAQADIQADIQIGIAPTAALAQMLVLLAPAHQRITVVTLQDAPALLRRIPVTLLSRLLPGNTISPEMTARLQRYGLPTLGHVATLTEHTLIQQFGSAGSALAALALGRDPLPFTPTPLPSRLHFRMRFPSATVPAEQVLAALPAWAQHIARSLRDAALSVRELRLVVGWDHGATVAARTVLRRHTHDPALLHNALRGLFVSLFQPQQQRPEMPASDADFDELSPGISRPLANTVRLTLLDLAPLRPEQGTFWHVRAKQQAALGPVTEALARRHGRALVLCARRVDTDAIFPEERYRLQSIECVPTERAVATRHTLHSSPSAPLSASVSPGWDEVPHRLHWW